MNRIDLDGRAAVVTGGAAGLGLGIARRLVESGADTCIWDVNEDGLALAVEELSAAAGGAKVTGRAADISDNSAVEAAFAGSVGDLGKVDILVNNAGISGPNVTSWEYPIDAWDKVVDINLSGTFYVSRAAIPHMLENDYGRIVNVASIAGKEGNPKAPAYSATKAGVIGLTKALGKELAQTNVMVNCVTPAAVRTAIFDQMTEEHIDFMLSKIPMNRFGLVEEIAAMVAWLASEECSFATGGVFDVSGGRATY
ncbi:MAG: SDR family NAD(P)-dependent oxidoreductase [Rhodospirillales bacterium]|nr:SDR family NAD(P)-dependent oxidoreductase [Rhodospirillales bacterium]